MQGSWNEGRAHYRCRYPAEYALANQIQHPRTVYARDSAAGLAPCIVVYAVAVDLFVTPASAGGGRITVLATIRRALAVKLGGISLGRVHARTTVLIGLLGVVSARAAGNQKPVMEASARLNSAIVSYLQGMRVIRTFLRHDSPFNEVRQGLPWLIAEGMLRSAPVLAVFVLVRELVTGRQPTMGLAWTLTAAVLGMPAVVDEL